MKELQERSVFFPVMSPAEIATISVSASASASQLQEVFARHGCALVTDVLDASQCDDLERLWVEDLLGCVDGALAAPDHVAQTLDRVHREGLSAWPAAWKGSIGTKGCASQRCLPHGQFSWAARLHPRIKRVFANLFDVAPDELATGLELSSLRMPRQVGRLQKTRNGYMLIRISVLG